MNVPHPTYLATFSGASAAASFITTTLPYLQWLAVVVAVLSGALSIVLTVRRLRGK